jgi:hypothetical protein
MIVDPYVMFVLIVAIFTGGFMFGLSEGRREKLTRLRDEEWIGEPPPPPNVITFIRGKFIK